MNFKYKKDQSSSGLEYRVWQREPLAGNLVIVVIDDEFDYADKCPGTLHDPSLEVFPLLRTHVTNWDNTRAVGFFDFTIEEKEVAKDLEHIQEWINEIKDDDTEVYFFVDVRVGPPGNAVVASDAYIKKLTKSYPPDQIAYLTKSVYGHKTSKHSGFEHLDFQKGDVTDYATSHGELSPEFMAFLGIKLHKDDIINKAIRFYAQAWNKGWRPKGWDHDELEEVCSDHSKALADWLGIDVNDLCNWQAGESAKALMIWLGSNLLWSKSLRRIQGTVLKAVLKKLLPSTTICSIPDGPIDMPCTPCFPLFVSLRNFLLRCEEKGALVSEIKFIQEGNRCTLRLMIKLNDPPKFEKRFRETHCEHKKSPPVEHTFTRTLIYLIYCMTEGLPDDVRRDYMRLFTDGTEEPVVEVEVTSECINLIWEC